MFASLHTAALTTSRVQSRGTRLTGADILRTLKCRFYTTLALHRQRNQLAALDDAALADIGLTRDAALAEAARPVWDVPAHWRH